MQEMPEPSNRILIMLRAGSRAQVDAIHATAQAEGWPVVETPGPQFIAPGYYGCILAVPGAEGIKIAIAHAWDDLPERTDAAKVRIAGADPDVVLGGYLFRPAVAKGGAVIVLHGYASNAHDAANTGARLAADGWMALCLSQRGWLGSTGDEDQGLRQPDDVVCAAEWLERETGTARIGLLGFSQGGRWRCFQPRAIGGSAVLSPIFPAPIWRHGRGRSITTASSITSTISSGPRTLRVARRYQSRTGSPLPLCWFTVIGTRRCRSPKAKP